MIGLSCGLICGLIMGLWILPGGSSEFPNVKKCSGGGICPLENTCCRLQNNDSSGCGCIPSDLGADRGTCCQGGLTGCGVGYVCASATATNSSQLECVASPVISDPLVQVLPRYHLCQAGPYSNFQVIHRFNITTNATNSQQLLYYSSHGSLEDIINRSDISGKETIQKVLIVIHGANRNADDYFCSVTAAVALQTRYPIHQVLVVAPRFVVPSDLPSTLLNHILTWADVPDGPWRYGAKAVGTNVSSFDVMDAMVEQLAVLFPHAVTTMVGHSSGGQFVQRWSLLSHLAKNVHAVAANPSSYAYLMPERYDKTQQDWIRPNLTRCPHYNQWEWGLETVNDTPDYVLRVLSEFRDINNSRQPFHRLIDRFADQSVVYLAGSMDRCNVSSANDGWCDSHGLEATCGDELQGTNRWERNGRYTAMLKRVGVSGHRKMVVHGVGHDHSLMFSSPEGLEVLFPMQGTGSATVE